MEEVREQHISPHFMPTRRLMHLPNVPVLLSPPRLNGGQRLKLRPVEGLDVNCHARIKVEISLHAMGPSVVLPTPPTSFVISLLPPEFSILQDALREAGLGVRSLGRVELAVRCTPRATQPSTGGSFIHNFLFREEGKAYLVLCHLTQAHAGGPEIDRGHGSIWWKNLHADQQRHTCDCTGWYDGCWSPVCRP